MKYDHKKLAAKYWDMLHPYVNFYTLKESQIHAQYGVMEKFLEIIKDMETVPDPHKGGFFDGNETLVSAGDHVEYFDGRRGTLVEALQDGDAQVKWDSGGYAMVKWIQLCKI